MTMGGYRPESPGGNEMGTGPLVMGVAISLGIGLAWELLTISTDLRLGFSPPAWEMVVGWVAFSAFTAFVLLVVTLAVMTLYATRTVARNPQSYDARQDVARARDRAATFIVGLGGLMAFGGAVVWVVSKRGPEFAAYDGFSRFTTVIGIFAVLGAMVYLRRSLEVRR